MSEPKTVTWIVINTEDDSVIYKTASLEKAEGYAECMKDQNETKCMIAKVALV